jgi:hypothetical protein
VILHPPGRTEHLAQDDTAPELPVARRSASLIRVGP